MTITSVQRYRKKPVEVEAMPVRYDNSSAVAGWCGGEAEDPAPSGTIYAPGLVSIKTLEGTMWAQEGDWVVKGTRGEFYPVKPESFEDTFEPCEPIMVEVDGLEHRLLAALATASAVALANGRWASEAERRLAVAEGIVTELRHVWPLLRGCEHDFDPECARCQWLLPLTEALQPVVPTDEAPPHSEHGGTPAD